MLYDHDGLFDQRTTNEHVEYTTFEIFRYLDIIKEHRHSAILFKA